MNYFQIKKMTIAISLLVICFSCNKEELKDVVRSGIGLTNKPVFNIANVSVVDAFTGIPFADKTIEFEIIGTPTARLYNMDGDSIEYYNQLIAIAVSPKDTPNINKPVKFSLRVSAKGYLPTIVPFIISSNTPESRKIRLLNVGSLPSGVKSDLKTNSGCKILRDTTLQIEFPNSEALSIKFLSNTTFFKNGKEICGSGGINATLLAFDYAANDITRFFPGTLLYKSITDVSGRELPKGGIFTTFGFFKLSITVGGTEVDSFSQPASVYMNMPSERIRAISGTIAPLIDTHEVIIYNSENDGQTWRSTTFSTLQNNKQIRFPISKTGWFNLGDPSCLDLYEYLLQKLKGGTPVDPICPPCTRAQLIFELKPTVNSTYFTKISLASNNRMIVSEPMMHYKDGNIIDLLQYMGTIDAGVKINFAVYDKEPWAVGSTQLFRQDFITACSITRLPMTNVNFPQYASIETDFRVRCPQVSSSAILPSVGIYVREDFLSTWDHIGSITNGKGATYNKLQCGKKYEFCINNNKELTTGKVQIRQNGLVTSKIKIPDDCTSQFSVIFENQAVGLSQTITMNPIGNKHYKMDLNEWIPSDSMCEKYRKYFPK